MFGAAPPLTPRPPPPKSDPRDGRGGDTLLRSPRPASAATRCDDAGRPSPQRGLGQRSSDRDPVAAYRRELRHAQGEVLDRLVAAARAPAVAAPSPLASAAMGGGIRGGSALKPSAAALGQPAGVDRLMSLWAAANPREPNFAPLGRTQVPALESAFDIHPELAQLKMRYSRLARAAIEPSSVRLRAQSAHPADRLDTVSRRSSVESACGAFESARGSGRSTPAYFEAAGAVEPADWGRQTVAAFLRLSRPVSARPPSSPLDCPFVAVPPAPAQSAGPTRTSRAVRTVAVGGTAVPVGRPLSARRPVGEDALPAAPAVYHHFSPHGAAAGRLSGAAARPTARPCPACRGRQQERAAFLAHRCAHEGGGMWQALRDADAAAAAAAARHRDMLHGGRTFFTVVDAGKVSLSPRRVDERMRGRYFHTAA